MIWTIARGRTIARCALVGCFVFAAAPVLSAEPRFTLRIPLFDRAEFPNFSAVTLPDRPYQSVEIVLDQTLAPLQQSTVRITLNEMPMTPFVALNLMPRGVRAILKLGASMSPDYALRKDGENVLTFNATDESGVTYRAVFYIAIDPAIEVPKLSSFRAPRGRTGVEPPPESVPPTIAIQSQWPSSTAQDTLLLEAEVNDGAGLRRVILEVNGKDAEEIIFQNERPVRKKNGLIARGALPGEVKGDGSHVTIKVPVKLRKGRVNVVAVRAENTLGLSARADRALDVMK